MKLCKHTACLATNNSIPTPEHRRLKCIGNCKQVCIPPPVISYLVFTCKNEQLHIAYKVVSSDMH